MHDNKVWNYYYVPRATCFASLDILVPSKSNPGNWICIWMHKKRKLTSEIWILSEIWYFNRKACVHKYMRFYFVIFSNTSCRIYVCTVLNYHHNFPPISDFPSKLCTRAHITYYINLNSSVWQYSLRQTTTKRGQTRAHMFGSLEAQRNLWNRILSSLMLQRQNWGTWLFANVSDLSKHQQFENFDLESVKDKMF